LKFVIPAMVAISLAVPAITPGREILESKNLGERGVTFDSPEPSREDLFAYGIGDVDGDSYGDLLIVQREKPAGEVNPLAARIIYGRPGLAGRHVANELFPRTAAFRASTPFGFPLFRGAPAGDANGDGLADFLLSIPYFPDKDRYSGAAFLVYGSKEIPGDSFVEEIGERLPGVSFHSSDADCDGLGRTLGNIGDFDGDGSPDLAIGCPITPEMSARPGGKVFILLEARDLPKSVDLVQVGREVRGAVVQGRSRTRFVGGVGEVHSYL
jgi:hypothetical protein